MQVGKVYGTSISVDAAELCKTRKPSWFERVVQRACGVIHSFSTGSVESQKPEHFNESEVRDAFIVASPARDP
jgi:hypothetical protein